MFQVIDSADQQKFQSQLTQINDYLQSLKTLRLNNKIDNELLQQFTTELEAILAFQNVTPETKIDIVSYICEKIDQYLAKDKSLIIQDDYDFIKLLPPQQHEQILQLCSDLKEYIKDEVKINDRNNAELLIKIFSKNLSLIMDEKLSSKTISSFKKSQSDDGGWFTLSGQVNFWKNQNPKIRVGRVFGEIILTAAIIYISSNYSDDDTKSFIGGLSFGTALILLETAIHKAIKRINYNEDVQTLNNLLPNDATLEITIEPEIKALTFS